MASKPVDNSVNERRLRPIYDWLDNGNNKKAFQEADKVLKKQPKLQCAKVLKALALIRLAKVDDAQVILNEVVKEEPCDDATLQAMAICFRETHQPEMTCQVYEAAVKKDPQNEEFLSHLFMAYVRVGDYRKQQQAAMGLYKVKPKNPYYFWAVMSILMQSFEGDKKVCMAITLPLAERMIKKFVDENKIEAEAEVQLYLMILEREEKYKEALDIINGPLGRKLSSSTVQVKTGEYLAQLKLWQQATDHYAILLRDNADQWDYYVKYSESLFEVVKLGDTSKIDTARTLLVDLFTTEESKTDNKLRGPYLARIYFWQQLCQRGMDATTLLGDVRHFFQDYVQLFGDKPCAFLDLKQFICNLPEDQTAEFLVYAQEAVALQDGASPTSVKQLCRHLLYLQLSRSLGRHESLSSEQKIALAEELQVHYKKTKCFNAGLLATDPKPNDGYALLAAHLLLDAWNKDLGILYRCLVLLENALAESPANYHLKLLMTRVYTLAGYGRAAVRLYELLDVKYIQLDSLGHVLSRPLISMGLPQSAANILASTLKFYTTHARETSECLISAYKFGSFSKIPEFTQFCQRLDSSAHFAAVTTERMLLDLLMDSSSSHLKLVQIASGMHADPVKDQPVWDSLVDNRDLQIFVSWNPPCKRISDAESKATFQGEVQFARLRNRLLHCILAVVSHSPTWQVDQHAVKSSNENGHPSTNNLNQLLNELSSLLCQLKNSGSFINNNQFSIQSPPPPRLYTYVADDCLGPFLLLAKCVGDAGIGITEGQVKCYEEAMAVVVGKARQPVGDDGFWSDYVRLERVYNAVEILGFCAIALSVICAALKTSLNTGKKKKKRDQKLEDFDATVSNYAVLLRVTTDNMKSMEIVFNQLDIDSSMEHLALDESDAVLGEIKSKLSQSRTSEMKAIISDKIKLLDACVLL